jgi:large subunit ribosomal protein L10
MPSQDKEKKVTEFTESLKKSKIVFIGQYQGLTVEQVSGLRRQLKENGSEMKIVKNTLARMAVEKAGFGEMAEHLVGPIAFFLGNESAVQAPKIVMDFAKGNELLIIRNGYFAGKVVDAKLLRELADLPPMPQLRIRFAMAVSAPPKKFLNLMIAPMKQFVTTLDVLYKKQSEPAN